MVCCKSRVLTMLLFTAAACVVVSAQTAAETVGMAAQGVDPWAALRNPWNLDVRDEINRPVSARKIEAELKAAAADSAVKNSFASRLPKAQAVVRAMEMLERLGGLAASFYASLPQLPPAQIWALPLRSRGASRIALPVAALSILTLLAGALSVKAGPSHFHPASCRPLVLRC